MDTFDYDEYGYYSSFNFPEIENYFSHYDVPLQFPSKKGKFTLDDLLDTHEYIKRVVKGAAKWV